MVSEFPVFKISSSRRRKDEEHVKSMFSYFVPRVMFSSNFLHAVTFHMFSTLMSLDNGLN